MDSEYLNDSLNLRDLIEQINEFARNHDCEPKNARSFFVSLFNGINSSDLSVGEKSFSFSRSGTKARNESNIEDSLLLYLQKLLSGNVPIDSLSAFTAAILQEKILEQLFINVSNIVDLFVEYQDCNDFFLRLSQQISPRFFQAEEIQNFSSLLNCSDFRKFLFDLIIHGFTTLYNIPAYFCARLLEEALSYGYDSPVRYELMRFAGDSNKRAALEYGKFLSKSGPYDQAFRFMIKALPMPAAIWNIAFLIEKHHLAQEEVKRFKNAIRFEKILEEVHNAFPELIDIICVAKIPAYDDLVCAFKTYAYLASKCLFFKGYNSMAKLLGTENFIIRSNSPHTKDQLIASYYRRAVKGANPTAMNNVGSALMNKVENGEIDKQDVYEQDLLQECLKNASDCGMAYSAYKLACYMEYYSSAPREEIMAQYRKVINLDVSKSDIYGSSLVSLGNLEIDPEKKIEYYRQALEYNNLSAIVYLANEYTEKVHRMDRPEYWLKELQSLYNRYEQSVPDGLREKVLQLLTKAQAWYAIYTKID